MNGMEYYKKNMKINTQSACEPKTEREKIKSIVGG